MVKIARAPALAAISASCHVRACWSARWLGENQQVGRPKAKSGLVRPCGRYAVARLRQGSQVMSVKEFDARQENESRACCWAQPCNLRLEQVHRVSETSSSQLDRSSPVNTEASPSARMQRGWLALVLRGRPGGYRAHACHVATTLLNSSNIFRNGQEELLVTFHVVSSIIQETEKSHQVDTQV